MPLQITIGNGSRIAVSIPENEMGVFLRAGYIIPTQPRLNGTSSFDS